MIGVTLSRVSRVRSEDPQHPANQPGARPRGPVRPGASRCCPRLLGGPGPDAWARADRPAPPRWLDPDPVGWPPVARRRRDREQHTTARRLAERSLIDDAGQLTDAGRTLLAQHATDGEHPRSSNEQRLPPDSASPTSRPEHRGNCQSLDGAPSMAVVERLAVRATEALIGHTGHEVIAGRYSYPLIEVYHPKAREWISASWLSTARAAYYGAGYVRASSRMVSGIERMPTSTGRSNASRRCATSCRTSLGLQRRAAPRPEHGAEQVCREIAGRTNPSQRDHRRDLYAHLWLNAAPVRLLPRIACTAADGCTAGCALEQAGRSSPLTLLVHLRGKGRVTLDG
jgi:hypothetical protein